MMRLVKRFFSMYSVYLWLSVAVIVLLTVLICSANNHAPTPASGQTGGAVPGLLQQNAYLCMFSAASVACMFLVQANKKTGVSPISWFGEKTGQRFSDSLSLVELSNYKTSVMTLAALLFVFSAYTLSAVVIGRQVYIIAALLLVLAIILASLFICFFRCISDRLRYLLIAVCMVFPVAITIFSDAYSSGYTPNTYPWLIAAITFSIQLKNRKAPKLMFKLFACALFAGILCELRLKPEIDFVKMVGFVSNIFYAGFVILIPMDQRMQLTIDNYALLESINYELMETQSQLVQREQMVTLGQLIAGVAHEINTPIGAIKASAEMLDTMSLAKIIRDMKRYDGEALETLITLLELCTRSTKNMRSTVEIRRGRAQVRDYLESVDVDRPGDICVVLAEMEICDVEKIETNLDLFRRPDIMEILISARAMKPFISSLQSISFASNGVSKIIFALKSFSHMNPTGERHSFDLIKNIDNVLVLYHNQIKRGIEVIKQYDEDIPLLYGNVEELSQLWTNIIQNAIHAMSYVGQLTITIRNLDGEKVSVAFTDTGVGIPKENIDKLFMPFFTTKPLGEGSGLGLDICKKVIERHDGEIAIESKPGQGATFTITLPVAAHEVSDAVPGRGEYADA